MRVQRPRARLRGVQRLRARAVSPCHAPAPPAGPGTLLAPPLQHPGGLRGRGGGPPAAAPPVPRRMTTSGAGRTGSPRMKVAPCPAFIFFFGGGEGTDTAPKRGFLLPKTPCPPPPRSAGHHQGPVPEGEMQPAQGVRGAGLPARHVHQPQEAGAQVRGRGRGGGRYFFWGGRGSPPGGFLSARCLCRIKQRGGCKPCHAAPLAPVCGSDGHTYSSAVSAAAIF